MPVYVTATCPGRTLDTWHRRAVVFTSSYFANCKLRRRLTCPGVTVLAYERTCTDWSRCRMSFVLTTMRRRGLPGFENARRNVRERLRMCERKHARAQRGSSAQKQWNAVRPVFLFFFVLFVASIQLFSRGGVGRFDFRALILSGVCVRVCAFAPIGTRLNGNIRTTIVSLLYPYTIVVVRYNISM